MFDDGSTQIKDVNIGATARKAIFVNEEVGPNKQASVKITSDDPIISERPGGTGHRRAGYGAFAYAIQ